MVAAYPLGGEVDMAHHPQFSGVPTYGDILYILGVLVLSFAAGAAGGITRELLLGAVQSASIADWRYIVIPVFVGLTTFWWHPTIQHLQRPVLIFDTAGLSLFAVTGALRALAFDLNPVAAVQLGVLTGVSGGMVRNVLVAEIPTVLRAEIYTVAALVGAAVVTSGKVLHVPTTPVARVGAPRCFGLRLIAIGRDWRLPVAPRVERIVDAKQNDDGSSRE